jgi:hypothetical protein
MTWLVLEGLDRPPGTDTVRLLARLNSLRAQPKRDAISGALYGISVGMPTSQKLVVCGHGTRCRPLSKLAERKEKMSHGPVVTIVARDVAMVGLVDSSYLFLIGRAAMVRNTNAADSLNLDHQVHSLAATDGAVHLHAGLGAAISLSR